MDRPPPASSGALARTLGLPALTFYGVGMILGAGIYSVIGEAAGHAGEALWLSFALAAAGAICTGLSYAELGAMFPEAGAAYVYVREALPRARAVAALVGLLLAASAIATATTVSLAFAGYLGELVAWPRLPVALGLVAAFTALNLAGVRASSGVNIVFTLIEGAGLVLVVVLGATRPDFAEGALAAVGPGVITATTLVFFAFLGFEDLANLAGEARDPARDLPRAIFLSVGVTTALYVAVALAVVTLGAPDALAGSPSPLADAAAQVHPRLRGVLAGVALFATANTGLVAQLVASRMLYGIAERGDLPRPLTRVTATRKTPWLGVIVAGVVAAALLPLGGVGVVAKLSSFAALIGFAAVNLALIVLRRRRPDAERPFRVPGRLGWLPLPPLLGLAMTAALLPFFDGGTWLAGGVTVALALIVWAAARRKTAGDRRR